MKLSEYRFSLGNIRKSVTKAVSPRSVWRQLDSWKRFWEEFRAYKGLCDTGEKFELYPCLSDWTATTKVDPTYFFQDAWAFDRIVKNAPQRHVDIGSHYKFVSLLSKVVTTTMVDIRPLPVQLESLEFVEGSILSLPFATDSLESVSSICVIEHIGLGRYTDPIDPDGTIKAIAELVRVLRPGGKLLISVPIYNEDTTFFNAHRAFTQESILVACQPLVANDFAYIYGREFTRAIRDGFGTICIEFTKPGSSPQPSTSDGGAPSADHKQS